MIFTALAIISFVSLYYYDRNYWKDKNVIEILFSLYHYVLILLVIRFILSVFIENTAKELKPLIDISYGFRVVIIICFDISYRVLISRLLQLKNTSLLGKEIVYSAIELLLLPLIIVVLGG